MIDMPTLPSDIDLPEKFTSFRSAQIAAAMRILHAFETTDNVILQAPPGVGKTLLSLLLARLVSDPRTGGKPPSGGTVITTVTKLLQQQYLDDFPDHVFTATGRDNWPCIIDPGNTAANAPCNHGWNCPVKKSCDYFTQRDTANFADVAVLNTAYYVFEKAFTKQFADHDLTIFDEAHELEGAILNFAGKWINPRAFDRLGYSMPRSRELREDGPWAEFWEDNLGDLKHDLYLLQKDVQAQLEAGAVSVDPRSAGRLRDLKNVVDIGHTFDQAIQDPAHWLLSPVGSEGAMQLRSAWGYTQKGVVFSGESKRLFMSGTILSPEFLAFSLGLDDWKYIELGSDFPAAQRPLHYVPTVKMSASATSDDLDHLVSVMDAIIKARHLGQKGIIHTVSYKLRDEIMARSKWAALMVTHNNVDRIATLEKFREMPEGYILVSPSMTTGVDLPADQCRWQMIPKMP
ncbi:MAG: DEAD/DEAH box helicase family protein, partial [Gemmatimonadaceae bacterium]|nr:DEAD/DEAH box helicase family protein [Gemmatimonadaceae bacterium]